MADQPFLNALQNLSLKMDNFNNSLGASQIKSFDGNPKEFKRWVKSVEKHALLERIPTDKIKFVAFKTSSGAVSDFIHRYVTGEPDLTWDILKHELSVRFAEITDSQHAFMALRNVKQEKNENVQIYAERLLSLAEQAYEGADNARVTEQQLVGFFVDGLYSDRLKLKIMRDNPTTMQDAIDSARAEYNLQQRFQLRTGRTYFSPQSNIGEPMEIDHFRNKRNRPNDEYRHRQRPRPRQVDKRNVHTRKVFAVHKPKPRSEITCWECNKTGHYSFECPRKKQLSISAACAVDTGDDLN